MWPNSMEKLCLHCVTKLFLDMLLLRKYFRQLLGGDQLELNKNLADGLSLVDIIECPCDFFLGEADPELELTNEFYG